MSIPREDRQELIADTLSKDLGWFFPEKDEPIPGADEELPDGRVPVYLAAAKLQMSPQKLRQALQQKRAPFGFAVWSEKSWKMCIRDRRYPERKGSEAAGALRTRVAGNHGTGGRGTG